MLTNNDSFNKLAKQFKEELCKAQLKLVDISIVHDTYDNLLNQFKIFYKSPEYCKSLLECTNDLFAYHLKQDQNQAAFAYYEKLEQILCEVVSRDVQDVKTVFFIGIASELEKFQCYSYADYYLSQSFEQILLKYRERISQESISNPSLKRRITRIEDISRFLLSHKYEHAYKRFISLWRSSEKEESSSLCYRLALFDQAHHLVKYCCKNSDDADVNQIYFEILIHNSIFDRLPVIVKIDFYYQAGSVLLESGKLEALLYFSQGLSIAELMVKEELPATSLERQLLFAQRLTLKLAMIKAETKMWSNYFFRTLVHIKDNIEQLRCQRMALLQQQQSENAAEIVNVITRLKSSTFKSLQDIADRLALVGVWGEVDTLYCSFQAFFAENLEYLGQVLDRKKQESLNSLHQAIKEDFYPLIRRLLYHRQYSSAQRVCQAILERVREGYETLSDTVDDYTFNRKQMSYSDYYHFLPKSKTILNRREDLQQFRDEVNKLLDSNSVSIQKIQHDVSVKLCEIIKSICRSIVTQGILGEQPCAFSLLGVGSISRHYASPYSDIDLAILIANPSERNHSYFSQLLELINHYIKSLGDLWVIHENRLSSSLHQLFFGIQIDEDVIIHCGGKNRLLLNTPEELAKWVVQEARKVESSTLPYVYSLYNPIFIYSSTADDALLMQYKTALADCFQIDNMAKQAMLVPFYQEIALNFIQIHHKEFSTIHAKGFQEIIHLKKHFISPITYWIFDVALFYGILTPQNSGCSVYEVLDLLQEKKLLEGNFYQYIKEGLETLHTLRYQIQLKFGRQSDWMKLPFIESSHTIKNEMSCPVPADFLPSLTQKKYKKLQIIHAKLSMALYSSTADLPDSFSSKEMQLATAAPLLQRRIMQIKHLRDRPLSKIDLMDLLTSLYQENLKHPAYQRLAELEAEIKNIFPALALSDSYKSFYNGQFQRENLQGLDIAKWIRQITHHFYLPIVATPKLNLTHANLQGLDISQWPSTTKISFFKCILNHACLDDVIAIGTEFNEAKLEFAQLNRISAYLANFYGSKLTKAVARHGFFKQANFKGAELNETDFSYSDLTQAKLVDARIKNVRFNSSNLTGANLYSAKDVSYDSIKNAKLHNTILIRAHYCSTKDEEEIKKLPGVIFSEQQLVDKKNDLSGINLSELDLTHLNLSKMSAICSLFRKTNFDQSNLSEANLRNANLKGADLSNVNLKNANLEKAQLQKASLSKANLQQSSLIGANLQGCDLQNAELINANLSNSDLQGANLKNANFHDCNLQGVNFKKADLRNADFRDAKIDLSTNWQEVSPGGLQGAKFSGVYVQTLDNKQQFHLLNEGADFGKEIKQQVKLKQMAIDDELKEALLLGKPKMNLSGEKLASEQVEEVLTILTQSKMEITEITLENNSLTENSKQLVAEVIQTHGAQLKVLNLKNTQLGDEGISLLANALRKNESCQLETLYLAENAITSVGAEALVSFIATNQSLGKLNLDDNKLGDSGAVLIATAIIKHPSCKLRSLSLANNQIGFLSCQTLQLLLGNHLSLTQLILSNNNIDNKGLTILVEGVKVDKNNIQAENVNNSRSTDQASYSQLESIYLDQNPLCDVTGTLLSKLLALKSLRGLALAKTGISDHALKTLLQTLNAYEKWQFIISIGGNDIRLSNETVQLILNHINAKQRGWVIEDDIHREYWFAGFITMVNLCAFENITTEASEAIIRRCFLTSQSTRNVDIFYNALNIDNIVCRFTMRQASYAIDLFLQHLPKFSLSLNTLSVAVKFADSEMNQFLSVFSTLKFESLKALSFYCGWIDDSVIHVLMKSVIKISSLKSLTLSNTDMTFQGFHQFISRWGKRMHYEMISFDSYKFSSMTQDEIDSLEPLYQECPMVFESLYFISSDDLLNKKLKLNITHWQHRHSKSSSILQSLAPPHLSFFESITFLDLRNLNSDEIQKKIATLLQHAELITSLRSIDLSGNKQLTLQACRSIAKLLAVASITDLNVSDMNLTAEQLDILLAALKIKNTVRAINYAGNQLSKEMCQSIADYLGSNPVPRPM